MLGLESVKPIAPEESMQNPHIIVSGEAGHGKDTVGSYLVDVHGYVRTAFGDPLKEEVFDVYANSPERVNWDTVNDREIKEVPLQRLALNFCSDKSFNALSVMSFKNEDDHLFRELQGALQLLDKFKRAQFSFSEHPSAHFLSASHFSDHERMALPRSFRRICQLWGTEHRRSASGNVNYWVDKIDALVEASETPVVITDGRFANELDWAFQKNIERINVMRPSWAMSGQSADARMLALEEKLKERMLYWMNSPSIEALSQLVHAKIAVSANIQPKHASEMIPPPNDCTAALVNDGSVAQLQEKTEEALQKFSKKVRSRPAL